MMALVVGHFLQDEIEIEDDDDGQGPTIFLLAHLSISADHVSSHLLVTMPTCPKCSKLVYAAEQVFAALSLSSTN